MSKRYCETCHEWVEPIRGHICPGCSSLTYAIRAIKDPKEVRKVVQVRKEFKEFEESIIRMIAESGALLEGHFLLE